MTEDIKQILDSYKEETKRHFDVVAEDLKGEIKTVAEQVGANTETLETIKLDLEFIKNELKQKVARDEFAVLEKRVSLLEGKLNR